jgi:hypothetical protein
MAIDLKRNIPQALQIPFWEDFMDVWSEELTLLKTDCIDPNRQYYYIRNTTELDQVLDIAKTFGLTIDRSIEPTLAYAKLVAQLLNFKVKYKTSYISYDFISKAIFKKLYVYNLYRVNDNFLRGFNEVGVLDALNSIIDYTEPFIEFVPEFYFSTEFNLIDSLDDGGTLDDPLIPNLDGIFSQTITNHLAIEYRVFNLLTVGLDEFFMTSDYLEYLLTGSNYTRKVDEIPHVGFQVNALTDDSGLFNNADPGAEYTTPAIKQSAQIIDIGLLDPDELINTFNKVAIGNGQQQVIGSDQDVWNQNLLFFYECEGTGSTLIDSTSNNNGQLSGLPTRVTDGIVNKSIRFNGSPQRGDTNNAIIPGGDLTVSFWLNDENIIQSDASPTLLVIDNITRGFESLRIEYHKGLNDFTVRFEGTTGFVNLTSSGYPFDGTDKFITVVIDSTLQTIELFINGVSADSNSIVGTGLYDGINNSLRYAWGGTGGSYYRGLLDSIRFQDRVMLADEILFKYNNKFDDLTSMANEFDISTTNIKNRYVDDDWYIISGFYPYTTGDIEDEIDVSEIGLKNVNDNLVAYVTFPTARYKKKFHVAFQFYIKRS